MGKKARIDLRVEIEDKIEFQKKAEEDGRTLSGWMVHTLRHSTPASTKHPRRRTTGATTS